MKARQEAELQARLDSKVQQMVELVTAPPADDVLTWGANHVLLLPLLPTFFFAHP